MNSIFSLREGGNILACRPIRLTEGLIIGTDFLLNSSLSPIDFVPPCDISGPYLYEAQVKVGVEPYYLVAQSIYWPLWITDNSRLTAHVFVCFFSAAFTICAAMLCVLIASPRPFKPWMQYVAVIFAFGHMLSVLVQMIRRLHEQFDIGILSVTVLYADMTTLKVKVLSFISNILLLLAQLQVATRLVDRTTEKVLTLVVGGTLVISSIVLTGLVLFHDSNDLVLFAVQYLVTVGLYISFAMMVALQAIEHRRTALQKGMLAHSLVAFVISLAPAAFFMADVTGWWIARAIDHVCSFSSTATIVIVSQWQDRLDSSRQVRAHEAIMGRQVFEDEDKQVLFESSSSHSGTTRSRASSDGSLRTAAEEFAPARTASAPGGHNEQIMMTPRPSTA